MNVFGMDIFVDTFGRTIFCHFKGNCFYGIVDNCKRFENIRTINLYIVIKAFNFILYLIYSLLIRKYRNLLNNEFDFWKVHGIMNASGLLQSKCSLSGFTLTLQETRSVHDSMNRSKNDFIAYIYILTNILFIFYEIKQFCILYFIVLTGFGA